ncbi:MAG: phosphocholine cytidylyltransferase family protein [Puniceicoccales bacterium]|jgi:choline kinase|nr:phosphocholine cytidylyltransferase family protein [Puniceicoccales bacterium]
MISPQIFILCAGEGQRLRPLTENQPKCLVPYRNKPLLQYQLEIFKALQLNDITLIGGYRHEVLPSTYAKIVNARYAETNMLYSLFCAENRMDTSRDMIIVYGDIIYHTSVLKTLLEARDPIAIVTDIEWEHYWKNRMEDPLQDAETFRWDPHTRRIFKLGEKPQSKSDIQGQYIGLFKISASYVTTFKTFYHHFCQSHANAEKAYITDFLQYLIDQQQPAFGIPIHNRWAEFDTLQDLQVKVDFL